MTYDPYADGRPRDDRVVVDHVQHVEHVDRTGPRPVDSARRLVWLLFGIVQALILLRIVLLLLNANEGNDLVAFITGISDPFVEPFRGMFSLDEVSGSSGAVLDVAALVALVAWTLIEALVLAIVGLADRRATTA